MLTKPYHFREVLDDEDLDNWDDLNNPKPAPTEQTLSDSILRRRAVNPLDPELPKLAEQLQSLVDSRDGTGTGDSATNKSGYFQVDGEPEKRPEFKGKFFTIPGE